MEDIDITTEVILMVRGNAVDSRLVVAIILEVKVWCTAISIRLISIASIHLTEDTLTHILVRYDVDSLIALAIVHTRKLCIIREFVEHLDAVYGLRWE